MSRGAAVRTVGLPSERKDGERRVVLDPAGVAAVRHAGPRVLVERGAGRGAGFDDGEYVAAGAELVASAADAWAADVVVKVKEPQPSEYSHLHRDLTLFAYLHLAADPGLAAALVDAGVTAYAFETVAGRDGAGLPMLAPMSEIAGRTAAIVGAHHLAAASGGSGTLLGGAAGVPPARVVVIGLGVAGAMAARGARGLDAEVTGVDVDLDRLRSRQADGTISASLASSDVAVGQAVAEAALVIGAALVPGARAPVVVRKEHVAAMRPGSVVVDLAIDQGGCVETARPTSHSDPVYLEHEVVHYAVTNVPGQYPRTASRALSAVVTPRLLDLLEDPDHPRLRGGCNTHAGALVHRQVAAALQGVA
jgi:alanine dehydrogenase